MINKLSRVLVVDDDLSLKPLWEKLVSTISAGTEVDWAVSGEEACHMIQQNQFGDDPNYDLIVSDLFLAGSITGIEFLSSHDVLRCRAKTIIVSAVDSIRLESQCRKTLPNSAIIAKPLNLKTCENAIWKLCSQQGGGL